MSFGEQVANFNRPQQRKSVRYEAASNSSQEVDDTFNFDVIKSKRENIAIKIFRKNTFYSKLDRNFFLKFLIK